MRTAVLLHIVSSNRFKEVLIDTQCRGIIELQRRKKKSVRSTNQLCLLETVNNLIYMRSTIIRNSDGESAICKKKVYFLIDALNQNVLIMGSQT